MNQLGVRTERASLEALAFFTDVLQLKNPQHPAAYRLMIRKNKLADAGLRYTSPYSD